MAALKDEVRMQLKQCSKLTPLAGAIEHMRAQRPLPESHAAHCAKYSIELLQLS